MDVVNMHEAKTDLSKLVALLESREEERIVIARHNTPVAMLVPFKEADTSARLGIAEGLFDVPDDIDGHNTEVAELFGMGV